VAEFLGHEVIRDNHIGDWGTQFGMVIYGWKNLLDRAALERDSIAELVRIYKAANELSKSDEAVRDACRHELVRLQAGDEENLRIWNECVALSMKAISPSYSHMPTMISSSPPAAIPLVVMGLESDMILAISSCCSLAMWASAASRKI
jgi:arginyl-tRNA synthetase